MDLTFNATAAIEGNTLSGVAYAFGQRTLRDGRWLTFTKAAFDEALQRSDARAFWNHDKRLLLGRQSSGTLRLSTDDAGLLYSMELPDTSYVADLKVLLERGDLTDMSFGILPGKGVAGRHTDGRPLVTYTGIADLFDISPVSIPAFGGTSTMLHSADSFEPARSSAIKARHRAHARAS